MIRNLLFSAFLFFLIGCSNDQPQDISVIDAKKFLADYEKMATEDGPVISSAFWIASNFINHDSQVIAADYSKRYTLEALEAARTAATFDDLELCLLYTSPSPRD